MGKLFLPNIGKGEMKMRFSLDNITLVGQYETNLIQLIAVLPVVESQWTTPNGRYHYNMKLINGGFLQLAHHSDKKTGFRLEFNPNRFKSNEKDLYRILEHCFDVEFSRRDIALDIYGEEMKNYRFVDNAGRKIIEYKTAAYELETIYFGAAESDERIRIYNKAKEQKVDKQWFRIEAQVRREKARAMAYNPFEQIKVIKRGTFAGHDLRTRAMLRLLEEDESAWAELSKPARLKYKKLLQEGGREEDYINVSAMFEKAWKELEAEAKSWLNFTRRKEGGTVIKIGKTAIHDEAPEFNHAALIAELEKEWGKESGN